MKIKCCKKICILCNALLLILTVFLSSCSKAEVENEELSAQKEKYYSKIFAVGASAILHDKPLANVIGRTRFEKGSVKSLLEIYIPNNLGIVESANFYVPETDKADWVEALLMKIEEERIAEEIRQMEESLEDYELDDDYEYEPGEEFEDEMDAETEPEAEEQEEAPEPEPEPELSEIELALEKDNPGRVMKDSKARLKILEYENEVFMPLKTEEGLITIHSSGKNVKRDFYDEIYRLTKTENWVISGSESADLKKTEFFEYKEKEYKPYAKKITEGKFTEEIEYNASGLVKKSNRTVEVEEKQKPVSEKKFSYNEEGKILESEVVDYKYKDKEYKTLDYSFTKKYTYSYNEGDIPPDFSYYEDGVLKMRNKYAAEAGTYTSQIFFDENMSVKTYFEKDTRVKEVFMNGNKVMREKVYEKTDEQTVHSVD